MYSQLISFNLPAAIEDLSGLSVPPSLLSKAATVRQYGGIEYISRLNTELPQLLQRNRELLDQACLVVVVVVVVVIVGAVIVVAAAAAATTTTTTTIYFLCKKRCQSSQTLKQWLQTCPASKQQPLRIFSGVVVNFCLGNAFLFTLIFSFIIRLC